jgi:hypothetical protein
MLAAPWRPSHQDQYENTLGPDETTSLESNRKGFDRPEGRQDDLSYCIWSPKMAHPTVRLT